jgi:fatty acid desaturase
VQAVAADSLPLALAIPLGLLLSLFIATRINALNVLVHEGSHYCLAANRRLNSLLTNVLIGYWILFDEDGYRSIHTRHHTDLNEATDPDLPLYRVAPKRWRLLLDFLSDGLWISVARRGLVYLGGGGGSNKAGFDGRRLRHAGGKAAANLVLLALLLAIHGLPLGALVYLLFWVVPLLSFYPGLIRIRIITEHFAPEIMDPDSQPVFVARSSVCGPIQHYLLGAQMDYHFEHHLFPAIPYRHLARMHAELVRRDFFSGDSPALAAHSLSGGYLQYWRRFLSNPYFSSEPRNARASA